MATYHWGTGHFKQYHFSAFHWGGVLAPVPAVVTPSRGGSGIWPYWRLEEKPEVCDEKQWVEKNSEKIKSIAKKKIAPMDPLEVLTKKKDLSEIEKKNQAIRALQDKVKTLVQELDKTKEEGKSDRASKSRMRKKIKGLIETISSLTGQIEVLKTELAQEKEKAAEAQKIVVVPVPVPVAQAAPEMEELAFQDEGVSLAGRLKLAAPWAIGAGMTYLGTRFLVPEKMEWLKFVGYTGATALSVIAAFKFLNVDIWPDWLQPQRAPGPVESQA